MSARDFAVSLGGVVGSGGDVTWLVLSIRERVIVVNQRKR
jgi:hypothetical protein